MDNTNTKHTTTTNTKAPFKRVRVVGKSNPYLTTNKDKHIKTKEPVKGGFRYTSKCILTVEKFVNKKLNNVDKEKTIEATKVFDHLKK